MWAYSNIEYPCTGLLFRSCTVFEGAAFGLRGPLAAIATGKCTAQASEPAAVDQSTPQVRQSCSGFQVLSRAGIAILGAHSWNRGEGLRQASSQTGIWCAPVSPIFSCVLGACFAVSKHQRGYWLVGAVLMLLLLRWPIPSREGWALRVRRLWNGFPGSSFQRDPQRLFQLG